MRIIELLNESTSVDEWIKKVYAQFPVWPLNHNQRVITFGGEGADQQFVWFELKPSKSKRNAVEIDWISAHPQRSGVGTKGLKVLQDLANKDGISLTLYPWDHGNVSQPKLMKFYKKSGFVPQLKGSKHMMWDPAKTESVNFTSSHILNEEISVAKYTDNVEGLCVEVISKALLLQNNEQSIIDEATSYANLTSLMVNEFFNELLGNVSTALRKFSNTKISNTPIVSRVQFIELPPNINGEAAGTVIRLQLDFLKTLQNEYKTALRKFKPNNINVLEKDPNAINQIFDAVSSVEFATAYFNNPRVEETIITMVDVFLHEMVHIIQNSRINTEKPIKGQIIRSYLSNRKLTNAAGHDEYLQKYVSGETDERFRLLYVADAREMAAFAHNMVQMLMRRYNLTVDYNSVPFNKVAKDIPELVKHLINPTNPEEYKVYNRYIKLTYQELERVYDHLTRD